MNSQSNPASLHCERNVRRSGLTQANPNGKLSVLQALSSRVRNGQHRSILSPQLALEPNEFALLPIADASISRQTCYHFAEASFRFCLSTAFNISRTED